MVMVGSDIWKKDLFDSIFNTVFQYGILDMNVGIVSYNKKEAIQFFEDYLNEHNISGYSKNNNGFSSGIDSISFLNFEDVFIESFDLLIKVRV